MILLRILTLRRGAGEPLEGRRPAGRRMVARLSGPRRRCVWGHDAASGRQQEVAKRTARPLEGSTWNRSDRRRRAFADDTACAPCPSSLARWPAPHVPAQLLGGRDRRGRGLGLLAGPSARRGAAGSARAPAARTTRPAQPGGGTAFGPEHLVGVQVAPALGRGGVLAGRCRAAWTST